MSDQRVVICTVGIGGWYPRGVSRMIDAFHKVGGGYEIQAWVNVLPPGTPDLRRPECDYTPYAAKPRALWYALDHGADIAILLDAAFFPIRHILPLVDWVSGNGYYLCKNGYKVGEWCSDDCLASMGEERERLMSLDDVSSYAVGINRANKTALSLANLWAISSSAMTICGNHTAPGHQGRNVGPVSIDPRVKGHRHDQCVLSILANNLGLTRWCERPKFTAYLGHENESTVLVNQGGI
jgi:hypothetical protein